MATGLERISAKAQSEPERQFTSLAHNITGERVWQNLQQIPNHSAPGVNGQTVAEAKDNFAAWILQTMCRQGDHSLLIERAYIPKPGKQEKHPLGVPCVADPAFQRSTDQVLSTIYEQDFLPYSFSGRPELGAHQPSNRQRPSSSNLVALRSSTRTSEVGNVRKRYIFWRQSSVGQLRCFFQMLDWP